MCLTISKRFNGISLHLLVRSKRPLFRPCTPFLSFFHVFFSLPATVLYRIVLVPREKSHSVDEKTDDFASAHPPHHALPSIGIDHLPSRGTSANILPEKNSDVSVQPSSSPPSALLPVSVTRVPIAFGTNHHHHHHHPFPKAIETWRDVIQWVTTPRSVASIVFIFLLF